ncbi:RNA-directed DNA polymerase from mobile element jockey [Elysia marginata]|uniref:RNA-directed DNA polymerase from mobile element jockey n=1 Tax=Elysia marginata TaxID=1093978 RepID=A0AAV4EZW9_9GAST|nr:RNA-directed DNA polymerase from mobile element jockey [Elysia marginata]
MDRIESGNAYELGCRLVKGPRLTVLPDTAGDKCAIGLSPTPSGRKGTHSKARQADKQTLNIIQINTRGISNKKTELGKLFNTHNIHVALLQETQHRNTDLHMTGYTPHPCKCKNCQGIVTYIRNDIHGEVKANSVAQPTDILEATVWFQDRKYTILNIYNPPANNYNPAHLNDTEFHQTILAGDFNGHSPLWGYKDHNKTGEALENISQTTNLVILQDRDSPPTLLHRAHNTLSRPDLTILSSDLHHKHNIQVLDDIGSDHLPILTTLHKPCSRKFERKTRWNFKKANWSRFKEATDNLLTAIKPTGDDPNLLCSQITEGILKAAADCIPRGCRKAYKPFWNTNIEQAVKTRQEARKQMEKNPTIENKILYNKTSALVKRKILNPNQAGFRTGQQTEDQLFRLSQKVIDGFQKKKNTTAVFVELQQTYDRVWRKGLLWKMREVGIHGRLYQWVKYFLVNRMIQTKINNGISSKLIQEEGLPQGSSLSCTLFLIFINDLPDVVQTEKALYADTSSCGTPTSIQASVLGCSTKTWKGFKITVTNGNSK